MKRFTETEKWRDTWFRKLPARSKLAFYYLVENCDCAGVWQADYELATFSIGEEVDWNKVLEDMGARVIVLGDGKWYLTRFIEFQYGPLSEGCKPHLKILSVLRSHGIPTRVEQGYHIPFPKGMERDKEEEEDKDKEKEGLGGAQLLPAKIEPPAELPLTSPLPPVLETPAFRAAWDDWQAYRRERRLPKLIPKSEAAQLTRLAEWGHDNAVRSIRESISQQWQGLFEPKASATQLGSTPGANKHQQKAPTAEEHGRGFFQQP